MITGVNNNLVINVKSIKSLSAIYANIRGLTDHKVNQIVIDFVNRQNIDFIFLSETWALRH